MRPRQTVNHGFRGGGLVEKAIACENMQHHQIWVHHETEQSLVFGSHSKKMHENSYIMSAIERSRRWKQPGNRPISRFQTKTRCFYVVSIVGAPPRTLSSRHFASTIVFMTSRCYGWLRLWKSCKTMGVSSKTINKHSSYARLKGVNVISVSRSTLEQKCHWRKDNYSLRYLLYESLIENKFRVTSRRYGWVRHEKFYRFNLSNPILAGKVSGYVRFYGANRISVSRCPWKQISPGRRRITRRVPSLRVI